MAPQPGPPPEAVLIRRARLARGLSLDEAARLVADLSGTRFSASRWSQLETGYRIAHGTSVPQRAKDGRLAQMAYVVGLQPSQLEDVGKREAAEVLRELTRQEQRRGQASATTTEEAPRQRSGASEAAKYFRDTSIPIEQRARDAARFLEVLSYLLRGEEPPPARQLDEERNRNSV